MPIAPHSFANAKALLQPQVQKTNTLFGAAVRQARNNVLPDTNNADGRVAGNIDTSKVQARSEGDHGGQHHHNQGKQTWFVNNMRLTITAGGVITSRVKVETGHAKGTAGAMGTATLLNAEVAIRSQEKSGGSSGGSNQQGQDHQGRDTPGGNQGGEGSDRNTGNIGGGGRGNIRPAATGASPGEPYDHDLARLQRVEQWRNIGEFFNLSGEQESAINPLLADLEVSQPDYDYKIIRYTLKKLASFMIAEEGGTLSPGETAELIEGMLQSKNNKLGCDGLVDKSAMFILRYPFKTRIDIEQTKADMREAIALTTRHDIKNPLNFVCWALQANQDYSALDVDLLQSPENDSIMSYFVSSSDNPRRIANMAVLMLTPDLPRVLNERWQGVAQPFNLSEGQHDGINALLTDIEQSHMRDYDFDAQSGSFRFFLKALASFLIADHGRGRTMSPEETLGLIDTLLTSKNGTRDREDIISNSASFIMSFPYKGDRANSDNLTTDYREAFALAKRHDIRESLLAEFSELKQSQGYMTSEVDILASHESDEVMAYLVASSENPRRKAAVAMMMMTNGLSADEATRDLDIGERAGRVSGWAQVMPGNTELSSFNQPLILEDALSALVHDNVSLLDLMRAPLQAFSRHSFTAERSFEGLERVLKLWNSDPLDPFLQSGPLGENAERASLSARSSLAQFPTALITQLARDGLDPETVAALLVGPLNPESTVPLASKHTVSILQGASFALTLPKLQELVPYLNESKLPGRMLISIATGFLGSEAQFDELEESVSNLSKLVSRMMSPDELKLKEIEIALYVLCATDGVLEINLDIETAETAAVKLTKGNIERQGIAEWSATRNSTVKLFLHSDQFELSFNSPFRVRFPGQEHAQPAEMRVVGYYVCSRLPPGTEVIIDFTSSDGRQRIAPFRLPPIRRDLE
jgi:hypothetical protein